MNKIILFLILSVILLFALFGHRMNEEYWNHFWGIRSESSPEEEQILYRTSQSNRYNSAAIRKAATAPIKNNYFSVNDRLIQYELRRSPFKGPHGESQYEFLLRKP